MSYDNIKNQKRPGFRLLFRRHIFDIFSNSPHPPKLFRAKEWHLSCFEKHENDIVWNRDSIKLWRQNLAPDARRTKEHFTLASF